MGTELAKIKEATIDKIEKKIALLEKNGQIHFPEFYSPQNALKSAWLILQQTENRNHKPALEVCSRPSIANALLDMVVQGLNPAKKQGYFIVYGKELVFQKSYFGTMALCKRLTGAKDIRYKVVYGADKFDYIIENAEVIITEHKQVLDNVKNEDITGAYCTIEKEDGTFHTEVMTIDMIKEAWKMSKMKPVNEDGSIKAGSTHHKFTADMALKTVINRTCKAYINSSDDNSLVLDGVDHINRGDDIAAEAEVVEEIEEKANDEKIDIVEGEAQTKDETGGEGEDEALDLTNVADNDPEWK